MLVRITTTGYMERIQYVKPFERVLEVVLITSKVFVPVSLKSNEVTGEGGIGTSVRTVH